MRSLALVFAFTACAAPQPQDIGPGAQGFDPTDAVTGGTDPTIPTTPTVPTTAGVGHETADGTGGGGGGGGDGDNLFIHAVHALSMEIPESSWDQLLNDVWGGGDYVGAYITMPDGASLEVGIKLTGQSSFQGITEKPSFKVKFDFFDEAQTWDGLKRFNLHNLTWDGSYTAEANSYRLYREMGLPAPRTSHAELTVNGELYGLYSVVENYDGQFLDEWFENDEGNLYEGFGHDIDCCNCFEIDIADEGNHDALNRLCDAVTENGEDWNVAVHDSMDWHNMTRALALEAWLAHWDGYSWNLNNYRLYHEPTIDRFFMFPWSTDLSYGWAGPRTPADPPSCHTYATDISEYTYGMMANDCRDDEECMADFLAGIEEINDLVEDIDNDTYVDDLVALLDPYVQADPNRPYSVQDFYDQNECFKGFMQQRPGELRTVLGTTDETGTPP